MTFDTVVIGAGHNGLVCATYLAKRGQRVLVVDALDATGGLASSREFQTGFRSPVAQHITHFPERISRDLDLARHGFCGTESALPVTWLSTEGAHLSLVNGQLTGLTGDIASEQAAFARYRRLMDRFAAMLAPFWLKTVPPIGANSLSETLSFAQLGWKLRRLGKDDMREFFRMIALPIRDLLDEYFTHPGLKAMLAWDALIGSRQAPRSPNNSVIGLLYRSANKTLKSLDVESLIQSLHASAVASGVELRLSEPVARVLIEPTPGGLAATGIALETGETIAAKRIVSSADPKTTFLELVGAKWLEVEFANRINRIRDRGLVSKLHLALKAQPQFAGLDEPVGRLILAPEMDSIEWAFDDAKYGDIPRAPVLEVTLPSLANAQLAPAGQHVLSASILYTPFKQMDGWSEDARNTLIERCLDRLERYAPGLRELVVGAQLLTPLDLESSYGASGGHWHHGDLALDQLIMMRPTYGAAQYRTPISGLFLCGAGSHPGGDLTGIPGHNAAMEILS